MKSEAVATAPGETSDDATGQGGGESSAVVSQEPLGLNSVAPAIPMDQDDHAKLIQAGIACLQAKREVARIRALAAERLQSGVAVRAERKRLSEMEAEDKALAIARLQALFAYRNARILANALYNDILGIPKLRPSSWPTATVPRVVNEESAARMLQARMRGAKARKHVKVVEADWVDGIEKSLSKRLADINIRMIQAGCRGWAARVKVKRLLAEKEAKNQLQAGLRGMEVRKQIEKERIPIERSAHTLQAVLRGKAGRKRAAEMYLACTRILAAIHGRIGALQVMDFHREIAAEERTAKKRAAKMTQVVTKPPPPLPTPEPVSEMVVEAAVQELERKEEEIKNMPDGPEKVKALEQHKTEAVLTMKKLEGPDPMPNPTVQMAIKKVELNDKFEQLMQAPSPQAPAKAPSVAQTPEKKEKAARNPTPIYADEDAKAMAFQISASRHYKVDEDKKDISMGLSGKTDQVMVDMQKAVEQGRMDDARLLSEQLVVALDDIEKVSEDKALIKITEDAVQKEEDKFEYLFHNLHQMNADAWVHATLDNNKPLPTIEPKVAKVLSTKPSVPKPLLKVQAIEIDEKEPEEVHDEWGPDEREISHIPTPPDSPEFSFMRLFT